MNKYIIYSSLISLVLLAGYQISQYQSYDNSQKLQMYQDPCEQIVYRSDEDFNRLITRYRAADIFDKYDILNQDLGQDPGVFNSQQAIEIINSSGDNINMRIEALLNIKKYIIYFTSEETIDLINSAGTNNQNARLEFLKQLVPFIKDPTEENKQKIISIFTGFLYQAAAADYLKDAKGVNCLWGAIPEKVATFIIDNSGSMNIKFDNMGKQMSRLDYVKQSLKKTIATQLQEYQKFNVIKFSSNAYKWQSDNVPATQENIDKALKWIDNIKTEGATNISKSLDLAYSTKEDLRGIYLLSDGDPNSGVTSPSQVPKYIEGKQKNMKNQVKINTISFMVGGNESQQSIKKSKDFLVALSSASQGSFKQIIDEL